MIKDEPVPPQQDLYIQNGGGQPNKNIERFIPVPFLENKLLSGNSSISRRIVYAC
jgi:hypothetical protein